MKLHYFSQLTADTDDFQLSMAKTQGYVPQDCLLGGIVIMAEIGTGNNPCWGCEGPREKCGGKLKRESQS